MSSVRGLPAWTTVLLAVAITLTGIAIDSTRGGLGAGFTIAFFLGCLLAVLAVSRRSVFVAGVQPPIIMAVLVPLVSVTAGVGLSTGAFSRTQLISLVLPLATQFPLMLATTLVVAALALIRAFILEPRAARPAFARVERSTPAHARR